MVGTYLFRKLPQMTPKKEERTKAREAPIKVYQIDLDLDARSIVESWVLSPNSARKTIKKAIPIDLSI